MINASLDALMPVYIPLVSRVFGPYCKLRIPHKSMGKKRRMRNLQHGPKKRV